MMQVRCQRCGWMVTLGRDAIGLAVAEAQQSGEQYYSLDCSHCRRIIKVPVAELRRHLPTDYVLPDLAAAAQPAAPAEAAAAAEPAPAPAPGAHPPVEPMEEPKPARAARKKATQPQAESPAKPARKKAATAESAPAKTARTKTTEHKDEAASKPTRKKTAQPKPDEGAKPKAPAKKK